jgi:acyl-coenzyme A synthetase/AMP-(fatty) acid ligase
VGVPGELCIAGAQVARGYLNKPEKTAEKFLLDPFDPLGKRRMYRTGDVCKWREDGNIEYVGRTDFQVKIRGYRIELGEVESALKSHERVQECVVVAVDGGATKRLAAYVQVKPGWRLERQEMIQHASSKLPAYMIPSSLMLVEAFPLTVNGKIDRRHLVVVHPPDWSLGGGGPGTVQDLSGMRRRTDMEEKVAKTTFLYSL